MLLLLKCLELSVLMYKKLLAFVDWTTCLPVSISQASSLMGRHLTVLNRYNQTEISPGTHVIPCQQSSENTNQPQDSYMSTVKPPGLLHTQRKRGPAQSGADNIPISAHSKKFKLKTYSTITWPRARDSQTCNPDSSRSLYAHRKTVLSYTVFQKEFPTCNCSEPTMSRST